MFENRSNLLINKKFQVRFAFFVCSWLLPLSLIYPFIIYKFFDLFIHYIAVDLSGPALATIEATRQQMFWFLVFIEVVFLLITFLISIFMSHRIAGPLYKLTQHMDSVRRGNFGKELAFRKNDHFSELAEDFNLMMTGIRSIFEKNGATANQAMTQLETILPQVDAQNRKKLESAIATLREIREAGP